MVHKIKNESQGVVVLLSGVALGAGRGRFGELCKCNKSLSQQGLISHLTSSVKSLSKSSSMRVCIS